MAIEFRCPQCSATLRTPDDSAGKLTACPQCKAELTIPATSQAAGSQPTGAQPADLFGGMPSSRQAASGTPAGELNPYAAPTQFQSPSNAPLPTGMQGNLDINDVFNRVWKIFQAQWPLCIGAMLVFWLLTGVNAGIQFGIQRAFNEELPGILLAQVVNVVIGVFLAVGMANLMLKIASGKPADLANLFEGGKWYLTSLGATIVVQIAITLGMFACIIPGFILALMLWPFQYLIIDRNLGVFDTLNACVELTKGQRLNAFACFLVLGIGGILAVLCTCGLGIFVVAPCLMLMMPVMYLILSGQPTADQVTYAQTNTFR